VTERAQLTVGRTPGGQQQGGGDPYGRAPAVVINPQYKQATAGDSFSFDCEAEGAEGIEWSRASGSPLSYRASVRGSQLSFRSVTKEDEGQYICTATNRAGSQQAKTMLWVQDRPDYRPEQGGQDGAQFGGVSVSPEDITVRMNEQVVLTCRVPPGFSSTWTKYGGQLPYGATQADGTLTIRSATSDTSGIYVCTVTGPTGDSQKAQARVTVQGSGGSPPTVRIEPERQTIGQGKSTELKCLATGNPPPKVTWTKAGEDLSSPSITVSGNNLMVRNAVVTDRGVYLCSAENSAGSDRASSFLEIEPREAPTIDIFPAESQTITTGSSVIFQCRAMTGIPEPKITWTREDRRPIAQNVELLSDGVLRITQVTGQEAGRYKCRAENEAGSVDAIVSLIIHQPPTIRLTPQRSVTIGVGKPLSIRCAVTGDPPPAITWKKLGGTATRQVGSSSPTFQISSITKQDEGTYACVATNAAGETEEWLQVIVSDDDEYGQGGGGYQGGRYPSENQGDRYQNTNQGGGYQGQNPGIRYPEDDQRNRYNQGNRYPVQDNRYPNRGDQSDGGQQYQPEGGQALVGQADYYVEPGNSVELVADVIGNMSASIHTEWKRRDGRQINSRHYPAGNKLTINNADKTDEGIYVCQGLDNRRNTIFEFNANLIILASPNVRLDPPQQVVRPGDSPQIDCQIVQGDQPIRIEWFRERDGGGLIAVPYGDFKSSVTQRGPILQFKQIDVSDQGRYICVAKNKAGDAEAVAQVLVNGKA